MTCVKRRPSMGNQGTTNHPLRISTLGTLNYKWTSHAYGPECWLDKWLLGLFFGLCDSWVFSLVIFFTCSCCAGRSILVCISFGGKRQFNPNVIFRGQAKHFKTPNSISPSLQFKNCILMVMPSLRTLSPRPLREGVVPWTHELICPIKGQYFPTC